MRKILVIVTIFLFTLKVLLSQTYTATLGIDDVVVSKLDEGDSISVPVRLLDLSGGKITGFQLFIEFDHSVFKWMGTWDKPYTGISFMSEKLINRNVNWVINDNGNQMAAIWYDPTLIGQAIESNEVLLVIKFVCLKATNKNFQSLLHWGETFEEIEGKGVVRGVTEVYSDFPDYYILTKKDGYVMVK